MASTTSANVTASSTLSFDIKYHPSSWIWEYSSDPPPQEFSQQSEEQRVKYETKYKQLQLQDEKAWKTVRSQTLHSLGRPSKSEVATKGIQARLISAQRDWLVKRLRAGLHAAQLGPLLERWTLLPESVGEASGNCDTAIASQDNSPTSVSQQPDTVVEQLAQPSRGLTPELATQQLLQEEQYSNQASAVITAPHVDHQGEYQPLEFGGSHTDNDPQSGLGLMNMPINPQSEQPDQHTPGLRSSANLFDQVLGLEETIKPGTKGDYNQHNQVVDHAPSQSLGHKSSDEGEDDLEESDLSGSDNEKVKAARSTAIPTGFGSEDLEDDEEMLQIAMRKRPSAAAYRKASAKAAKQAAAKKGKKASIATVKPNTRAKAKRAVNTPAASSQPPAKRAKKLVRAKPAAKKVEVANADTTNPLQQKGAEENKPNNQIPQFDGPSDEKHESVKGKGKAVKSWESLPVYEAIAGQPITYGNLPAKDQYEGWVNHIRKWQAVGDSLAQKSARLAEKVTKRGDAGDMNAIYQCLPELHQKRLAKLSDQQKKGKQSHDPTFRSAESMITCTPPSLFFTSYELALLKNGLLWRLGGTEQLPGPCWWWDKYGEDIMAYLTDTVYLPPVKALEAFLQVFPVFKIATQAEMEEKVPVAFGTVVQEREDKMLIMGPLTTRV